MGLYRERRARIGVGHLALRANGDGPDLVGSWDEGKGGRRGG
jgi:hypothetical protein